MKNLGEKPYFGEVVDNKDPEFMGRCRVRVFGLFDTMKPEHIPWAFPAGNLMFAGGKSGGFGQLSVPKMGTKVALRFNNGDVYAPEYFAIIDINEALQQEFSDSYENAWAGAFDEDEQFKVIYKQSEGLRFFHKESHLTINPDTSITLEHSDSKSIIELVGNNMFLTANTKIEATSQTKIELNSAEVHVNGNQTKLGTNPIYSNVNGEQLMALLKALAVILDLKWSPTPGAASNLVAQFEALILSRTVTTTP